MTTGVVLPYWQDRPPLEALDVARAADRGGFDELWIGEMATFDAFAIAAAIARETERVPLTIGPLAAGVRDPVAIARGIASVATLAGRPVGLALGASTPAVVSAWHGRRWERVATTLRETIAAVRPILAGEKAAFEGEVVRARGFRLRLDAPRSPITLAAFGARTVALAAEAADRMVVNLLTPEQAATLRERLEGAARAAGRPAPPLAAWVVAAVDPAADTLEQIRTAIVPYLAPPGYGEMFAGAGFGALVERARAGAHPRDLRDALPAELIAAVAAVGDAAAVRARIAAYRAAGVDHVAIVPATAGDPAGARTLAAVNSLKDVRRGTSHFADS